MNLPQSSEKELLRSHLLTQAICQEINITGASIPFDRFMELALYHDKYGYYQSDSPKFGVTGDFITAPEISPLFAECIAIQCQQIFNHLQSEEKNILEIGAGSGVFAKDLLIALENSHTLPHKYYIYEKSSYLRQAQEALLTATLPHLINKIEWISSLSEFSFSGMIFANEVIDAMPARRFCFEENKIKEYHVDWDGQHFVWQKMPLLAGEECEALLRIINKFSLEEGYIVEIKTGLLSWMKTIAALLKKGIFFIFDYGYGEKEFFHPDRKMGSLVCYRKHYYHENPLILVGLQDSTTHVNFTVVVDSAEKMDLHLMGYTTQSAFLLACGLLEIAQKNPELSEIKKLQQTRAIKLLTLPSEMGESIKVMGLGKNLGLSLLGFSLYERRQDL